MLRAAAAFLMERCRNKNSGGSNFDISQLLAYLDQNQNSRNKENLIYIVTLIGFLEF